MILCTPLPVSDWSSMWFKKCFFRVCFLFTFKYYFFLLFAWMHSLSAWINHEGKIEAAEKWLEIWMESWYVNYHICQTPFWKHFQQSFLNQSMYFNSFFYELYILKNINKIMISSIVLSWWYCWIEGNVNCMRGSFDQTSFYLDSISNRETHIEHFCTHC